MRKTSLFALTTVSVAALTVGAAPAFAQGGTVPESCAGIEDEAQKQACADAAEQTDPNANSGDQATSPTAGGVASAESTPGGDEAIVVTGSRLRRDERTSADPVAVIDPTSENREGQFDTAEILQSSPLAAGSFQITSAISSNFVINGGEGAQSISLRGLGANRTLVLLNGRRAGPAGTRGGVSAFDLNVIPQDAIQSVEILKTGASSVYGSDAIAGVVNLITKKDLEGFRFNGFVSAPEEGGGEQYSISGTYGLRLGSRGHITLSANYYHMNELERRDRDFLGCVSEYVFKESDGTRADPIDPRTGQPYCTGFNTAYIAVSDLGLMRSSNLFGPVLPDATPPTGSRRPITSITFGPQLQSLLTPTDNGLFFNTNPTNPTQFRAPAGFVPVGGHSATALALFPDDPRAYSDSVYPETKRLTFYGEAGYDLTDDVELYFEGLYNSRKTRTDASGQIFFSQFPRIAETVYSEVYGAYYLPYFFCAGGLGLEQCNPNARGDPINTGFTGGALLTPVVYRPFNSHSEVKYLRGVAGLRANLESILPKGFLDFYFQHSRSDGDYTRDVTFRDAIEFGVAEFRTQSCVGTVTAIRGVPCIDINYTDPRVLAGNFNDAERAFLFSTDTGNTKYTQNVAELTFGGDLFTLPGGPVRFALGGQWRRDKINDVPGPITQAANVWGATTAGVTAGFQRTMEAFGEIEFPLLRDTPGFYELTVNGAARLTSTKAVRSDGASDSDNGNWTYKIGLNWAPFKPIRFRATYGTSFRSPALFEQFLNNETGFLGQGIDPCIRWGLSQNQEIRTNCASQGIPDDYTGAGGSAETRSQGNVGQLDPETSRAITASVIFTPDGWFWDGAQFSLAVDYIDIKVKDQVTQLGAANILAACYTSDFFPTDPLCSLFTRDLNPQSGTAFNIITVDDPYFNIDQQHNKSLDFTARFRQDMGKLGTLSLLGQLTYQLRDKFTLFQGTTVSDNGESGDPKWIGDLSATWVRGPITLTYGLRVISSTSDLEDLAQVGGTQFTGNNCLATNAAFALRGGPYCPVYKLPRVAYHSLSAEVKATDRFTFLVGVANLFDKKPPLVSTVGAPISAFYQVPTLGSYYDYFGRRLFASARFRF